MSSKNLVLVHQNVQSEELLMASLVKPENFLFNVSNETTTQEVLDAVQEIGSLENIALIYHYPGYSSLPFLRVPIKEPTVVEPVEGEEPLAPEKPFRSTYYHITDSLVELLKELKNEKGLTNVDILTCDLNNNHFKEEMVKVEGDVGITINYSFNSIGHSVDWILESNGESIKEKYFNSEIDKWSGLLSTRVELPKVTNEFIKVENNLLSKIVFNTVAEPWVSEIGASITDSNGNTISLIRGGPKIETTINITYDNQQPILIQESEYTYNLNLNEAQEYTLTLTDSYGDGWSGAYVSLIYDDNSVHLLGGGFNSGFTYPYDIDLNTSKKYTLLQDCSITDIFFGYTDAFRYHFELGPNNIFDGNGFKIDYNGLETEGIFAFANTGSYTKGDDSNYPIVRNLSVINGKIINDGGGIIKKFQQFFKVYNCSNACRMSTMYTGGIVGMFAGFIGECTIKNCYNNGIIDGDGAGGIVGSGAGAGSGEGSSPELGSCTIKSCYNNGIIDGDGAGGIAGSIAGFIGECTIINCYNTGTNSSYGSGGIAGSIAGFFYGTCKITNCYNTSYTGSGIAGESTGSDFGTCTITNCYAPNITEPHNVSQYVDSVASDANSVTVSNSDNINSIYTAYLYGKFTSSSDYIPDIFRPESPSYPMLKGIFENFYKYDNYNATGLELISNKIRNATTVDELKEIFDLNTTRDKKISAFIQKLKTNGQSFKIYWGEDGELVNAENVGIRYAMVRIPKSREIPGDTLIVEEITETTVFNSGVLVFERTLTELKERFTLLQLKDEGLTLEELITVGFTVAELKAGGFTAADLREGGFTLSELLDVGYTFTEVVGDNPITTISINFIM